MSCTGFDGSLGIGSADADIALVASYTEVPSARDINVSISSDKADVSDRTSAFKNYVAGGLDCEITATLTYDSNDATQSTIRTACIARTRLVVGVFDAALSASSEGIAFDAYVFSNDIAQPLADGQTYSVSFAPASSGSVPAWSTLS
jgi:hypothetical protein|tara:strand:+ start:628 stop:1068 length:441 start_codon:yes stop_codon:yes gene_type:complete